MNYSELKQCDVANGPGVRVSLFVSGCTNHCKGCFNPETWDFNYGNPFTNETMKEILLDLQPSYITGFSILGGDPMHEKNMLTVYDICNQVKQFCPDKTIWMYTGYLLEDLFNNSEAIKVLKNVDILVDGPFIEEKKDLHLRFRGSSNQRIIDVKKTWDTWNNGKFEKIITLY